MIAVCVQVNVRKGDTIGGFLKAVREQLAPQFRELRATSVDNMMYVKVSCQQRHRIVGYCLCTAVWYTQLNGRQGQCK